MNLSKVMCNVTIGIYFIFSFIMPSAADDNKCKSDPKHTMKKYAEEDIATRLHKNSALWNDTGVIDNRRVPNDIKIISIPENGWYRNVRPTRGYFLPEIKGGKFGMFGISCRLSCNYRMKPACIVRTRQGQEMLAFFQGPNSEYIFQET